MKIKLPFTAFLFILSVLVFAQTKQNTTLLTIETISGGKYSGRIVSETSDSIKIETKDFGLLAIAKNDMIRNLFTIETVDGNELLGEIISQDSLKVRIKTDKLGEITGFCNNEIFDTCKRKQSKYCSRCNFGLCYRRIESKIGNLIRAFNLWFPG